MGPRYTHDVFMGSGFERKYYVFALRAFSDITGTVLVPPVAILTLRDIAHLSTAPFVLLLIFTFIGTAIALFRKIKRYGSAYQQLGTASDSRSSTRG